MPDSIAPTVGAARFSRSCLQGQTCFSLGNEVLNPREAPLIQVINAKLHAFNGGKDTDFVVEAEQSGR
jgi:hypothetical protein